MALLALGLGSLMKTWESEVLVLEGPAAAASVSGLGVLTCTGLGSGWQATLDGWLWAWSPSAGRVCWRIRVLLWTGSAWRCEV